MIVILPQGILAMTVFVGAMMLGAVPAFIAYPNDKVEPSKYRFGVAGVTANLNAKVVVIDEEFPEEILGHVSLGEQTTILRVGNCSDFGRDEEPLPILKPTRWRCIHPAFSRHDGIAEGCRADPPCRTAPTGTSFASAEA